ncbi:hypothetical protein DMN91_006833 [Ooceraea biroi]|uniref:Uncharacterized protein n=1 Tax=Ooceraea biroi TaxID=2015173 RepID=A0A3L8DIS8_OOCBI|nr:uncharacterized protein LOC105281978 [Ooceraea biroi]RLU20226.1 hypothetical protein DMN91_006833 [Ooceraea biroi]
MNEYMSDYVDHLKSLIPAKHDPETDPVLCVDKWDLLDEVRQMLTASFKAAISQKQTRLTKMETNDIARPIEDRMGILYKKINKAESKVNDVIALAICYSNMSIVRSRHETKKKLLLRKSYLKKSLELLNRKELDRRAILIVLRASLQLECVYHKLNEPEKCYSLLHKALALCHKYTKYGEKFPAPIIILCVSLDGEPFEFYPNSMSSFVTLYEKLVKPVGEIFKIDLITCSLHSLAKVVHKFLMRQSIMVMANPEGRKVLIWVRAVNELSICFSHYCAPRVHLNKVRNCLAAAQYVLELYEKVTKETSNN